MSFIKGFIRKHKLFSIQVAVVLSLIITLIVLSILKTNQEVCEAWTRGTTRFHETLFGKLTEWIPFSLTELLMFTIIIACITLVVLFIIDFVHLRIWAAIGKIMTISIVLLGIFTAYSATFEMGYNRKPVDIPMYQKQVKEEDYYKIVEYFVDDLNKCVSELEFEEDGNLVKPYSNAVLNDKVKALYANLDSDYFGEYTPNIKPMISSYIYRMFCITGWHFAPLGECVVNNLTTSAELPFTYAHEMSHSKGVANEDDAQLTAAYVSFKSDDPYIRYSAYAYTVESLLDMAKYSDTPDAYKTLVNKIDNKVWKNFDYINKYWDKHGVMEKLGDKINDWYLKLSGDKEGTASYSDSPTIVDNTGKVISLSRYQKLYVQLYVDIFPSELS